MAILEYQITHPPTSAEVDAYTRERLNDANKAARGLLQLRGVLVAPTDKTDEPETTVAFRARTANFASNGVITRIIGDAVVGIGTADVFNSESAVVELAEPTQPATIHIVKAESAASL